MYFKDKIKKDQGNTRNGNIISNSSMSLDLAVREAFIEKKSIKTSVREVVLLLRRGILYKSFNKVLPPDITVKDLTEGEAFVPEFLEDFSKYLLCGANQRRGNTARNERRVSSFAQDAIYAVSNGKVKPSKHLTLGMAMKSITSSRRIVDILNCLGHCVNYSCVEELETELTFTQVKQEQVTPVEFNLRPDLVTGVA